MVSLLVDLLVLVGMVCLSGVQSVCPPDGVETFVIVPPEQYDRNVSQINVDDGARPLGYLKGSFYHDTSNGNPVPPNPCIKLENTANKRVEIMIETIPEARVCVKTENPKEPKLCGQGNINQCRRTNADQLHFEFFCDAECADLSSVTFWYRFALSPNSSVRDPELWCDERDPSEYPSSLQELPTNLNPKEAPTDKGPTDGASVLAICGWMLTTILSLQFVYQKLA